MAPTTSAVKMTELKHTTTLWVTKNENKSELKRRKQLGAYSGKRKHNTNCKTNNSNSTVENEQNTT